MFKKIVLLVPKKKEGGKNQFKNECKLTIFAIMIYFFTSLFDFLFGQCVFGLFLIAFLGISVSVSAYRWSKKWTLMPLMKMFPYIYAVPLPNGTQLM